LSVAEGEPWTGGGWTKIASKTKDPNDPRPVRSNGHDETIKINGLSKQNVVNADHCKCDGDGNGKHGYVFNRKQAKGNQPLSWEMEHID
jgi:hypothetical protein